MKRLFLIFLLILSTSGCCSLSKSDEALMREIRSGLVESTRPTLVEALNNAREHDGMIDPLRTERVRTVDQMIDSVDRVYPPIDEAGNPAPYEPSPLPWEGIEGN